MVQRGNYCSACAEKGGISWPAAFCVFIRCGRKYVRINYLEISHIESVGNYAKFYVAGYSYLALLTIKSLVEQLPEQLFFRVNRGVVVSMLHIHSFDKDGLILNGGAEFSFGEDAYKKLLNVLPLLGRGNFYSQVKWPT